MSNFHIKKDDTYPVLVVKLKADNKPVDLTGATVTFNSRVKATGVAAITDGACTILNATQGKVSFTFSAAQTATAQDYEGEFQVDFGGGSIGTWPPNKHLDFTVYEEVA
jgi:hypothetical protein